jgi:hypothetical protein
LVRGELISSSTSDLGDDAKELKGKELACKEPGFGMGVCGGEV